MACTQHIVCFIPPPLPDLDSLRGPLKSSRGKEKGVQERDRCVQDVKLPSGANGNIHGTTCFRFVDLAGI